MRAARRGILFSADGRRKTDVRNVGVKTVCVISQAGERDFASTTRYRNLLARQHQQRARAPSLTGDGDVLRFLGNDDRGDDDEAAEEVDDEADCDEGDEGRMRLHVKVTSSSSLSRRTVYIYMMHMI